MLHVAEEIRRQLPRPTMQFRRRCWLEFQKALDPFAPPRALRMPRRPSG